MNEKNKLLKEIIKQEQELAEKEKYARKLAKEIYSPLLEPKELEFYLTEDAIKNSCRYYKLYQLLERNSDIDIDKLYKKILYKLKKNGYLSIYKEENDNEYNDTIILKKPYLDWILVPVSLSSDKINFHHEIGVSDEMYDKILEYLEELKINN